jgi:hypothetical protein
VVEGLGYRQGPILGAAALGGETGAPLRRRGVELVEVGDRAAGEEGLADILWAAV